MEIRRALLVGAGEMGRNWGKNLRDNRDVNFAAWVDVRPEAAEQAAANLGISDIYIGADLERAIAEVKPDFVVDVSPPEIHHRITLQALGAGLPVLGEKPMADSMEHAREMVAASERAGKLYMVSQNRRQNLSLAALRQLIVEHTGSLGVLNADFSMGEHYRGFRATMPSPLLIDMAIHTFDAARFLSGADPVAVYCEEFNPPWSWYKGNACATAMFEMTGGLRFTYYGSRCSDGHHTSWDAEWRAVGPHGTATWDGHGTPSAELTVRVEGDFPVLRRVEGTIQPSKHGDAMMGGIDATLQAFLHGLETGTPPPSECHDNIKSLAMVFGAVQSAATGKRVDIPPLYA
jgi:predicted dehydrogenase